MKKTLMLLIGALTLVGCNDEHKETISQTEPEIIWERYDESAEIDSQEQHENKRMRFKLIQSKLRDKNDIWTDFEEALSDFSEEKYDSLRPLILERSIPELQRSIRQGKLSYEDLTLFYIYRIRKYESDNKLSLNAVIALNPDVLEQARALDNRGPHPVNENSVYGMPIMLKDNIDLQSMPTTAGAVALAENLPSRSAFLVEKLQDHKALILGKVNLSEWAYYFCEGCPLGYSAVGGQTLNPYGRKKFETGGSSSGSGVAVAANYCVAAVGTETAGSILSPASQNSVVGLKPTVGLVSRSGVVPISGTLDTPGPMTKTVVDNAILLNALVGKDERDAASVAVKENYVRGLEDASLEGKRFGVIKSLLKDSLYASAITHMRNQGAILIEYDPPKVSLEGFSTLLDADMKRDLPVYLRESAGDNISYDSIQDIVEFNRQDSLLRAPYGQQLFEGIVLDTTNDSQLEQVKQQLLENGRRFFEQPMNEYQLDAVLSINNYHAAHAAVARFPALAVPAGYEASGEPKSITFIGRPFEEAQLLQMGRALEKEYRQRRNPSQYP